MGNLIRARAHRHVLEPVELALVTERFALPRLSDDLQRLLEARLTLAIGDSQHVVGAWRAAAANPEIEAALAQRLSGRDPVKVEDIE